MKKRILKMLAAVSLSACILAGGTVSGLAAEPADSCEHVWQTVREYKEECVETAFSHRLEDGSTETIRLCAHCGKENGTARLTQVKNVFSNFSGLTVYSGALKNGQQVMTVAFYYPTYTEKVICEKCGKLKSETTIAARYMASPVNANIELPAEAVTGYTLLQLNADGSQSPVEVSISEDGRKAFFQLNVTTGPQLLYMVPTI